MKKNDKKSNQRLKSIVLLLLVTGVVIGLVSSTAIKLASATYLMQKTQKPIIKVPKVIEQFIDSIAPTSPTTTKPLSGGSITSPTKPVVNNEQTTTEKEKPTQPPTTQAPTTQAPTTQGSTNPPTTADINAGVKADQANFNSYKAVVERAKASDRTYTKTTNRSLDMSFFQSLAVSGAENIVINDEPYFYNKVETVGKANADKALFINNPKACLLTSMDLEATKKAISSTSREELKDGTIKIVINFKDEADPKPLSYEDTKTEGFISAVFPVIAAEQVRYHADDQLGTDIESINLLYTGCYVELIYVPSTGDIISLKQVTNCVVDGKDGFKNVGGTITEVNEYVFEK